MPTVKKGIVFVAVTLATTVLSGCAAITVENDSVSVPAIVKLKVPDSSGYEVIRLGAGGAVTRVSIVGGAYSLIVLPDQEYLAKADALKDKLETTAILKFTQTDPEDMFTVLQILKSASQSIENMKAGSAACAAHVGDYEDAYASVNWDEPAKHWIASCSNGISSNSASGMAGILGF